MNRRRVVFRSEVAKPLDLTSDEVFVLILADFECPIDLIGSEVAEARRLAVRVVLDARRGLAAVTPDYLVAWMRRGPGWTPRDTSRPAARWDLPSSRLGVPCDESTPRPSMHSCTVDH